MMILLFLLLLCLPVQAQTYFSSPPYVLLNVTTTSATYMNGDFNQIVSDGNNAFNSFEQQIAATSTGSVPSGAIVAFNLGSCPTGWVIANGTGGTPDMRGYFVRATGGTPVAGTFQNFQMANHKHNIVGTYINNSSGVSSNFNTGSVIRMTAVTNSSVGGMITGKSASETRPRNVALLYCMKS